MESSHSFLSLWAYRLFLAGLFILPLFVWVSQSAPLIATKVLVATVALVGASILGLIAGLRSGSFEIPVNWLVISAWGIPLAYTIALLVSPSITHSLFGESLDLDTVFFMGLIALAATVPMYLFRSRADTLRAFFVLLVAAWVVAAFQLIRLVAGPDIFAFGLYTSPLFSLVGKWNDLSIFFGLVSMMSLIALEMLPMQKMHQYIVSATLVVSLFFVALVNFVPVWVALGVVSLGIVLYRMVLVRGSEKRVSIAGIIILVLAIVSVLFSSSFGASLGTYFGTAQIEARPSFGSTLAVATQVLKSSPLLGSGPNTFLLEWDKFRPAELNNTIFWNADFTSGVGFILTSVVTVGLLGALAWLIFIALFVLSGVRSMLMATGDQHSYHLMLSTYVAGGYLIIMSLLYLPSPALIILGFAMVGMFASLSHTDRNLKTIHITFAERPRTGFLAVLLSVLLVVGFAVTLYNAGSVYAASSTYERAAIAAQRDGNLDGALSNLNKAIALYPEDRFYRLAVLVNVASLNALFTSAGNNPSTEAQQQFQQKLGAAVENGLKATRLNSLNYRNWQALGSAYQTVVPLNVQGSYDAAVASYAKAQELNPILPTIPFARAQLEVARGDSKAARGPVTDALKLKQDYIPALLLLAQIELSAGNIKEAIKKAESASVFEPSNAVTRFQIGVLKFVDKQYDGANDALTAAVQIAPDYANAHYYLGRTMIIQGKKDDALKEFEIVKKLNPDNADVTAIITALQAGKDPFADTKATDTK